MVAVMTRKFLQWEAHSTPSHFHDLGKLVFAFCLLWTYLGWSHYLPIWYGNLPEETGFLLVRARSPWAPLAGTVLAACFVIPFVVLLSREVKRRAGSLFAICAVVVVGMWLERYLLVVPSVWSAAGGARAGARRSVGWGVTSAVTATGAERAAVDSGFIAANFGERSGNL